VLPQLLQLLTGPQQLGVVARLRRPPLVLQVCAFRLQGRAPRQGFLQVAAQAVR